MMEKQKLLKNPYKYVNINKLREYKEKGFTIKIISKRLGVSTATIVNLCKEHNIGCKYTGRGRKRCISCNRLVKREEMKSNKRGLFCPECWEKRHEVVNYKTDRCYKKHNE